MHIPHRIHTPLVSLAAVCSLLHVTAAAPALKRSDVVFMYQSDPKVYGEYGATVLAWGGTPTPESNRQNERLTVFGSVGMVTEFARYYERFPDTYAEGLCRDLNGQPVKVPWLTDHQHKGVPFWWCCTQQPQFRQFLRERVIETIKDGANGIHIDDHMGTAGGLWLGICFCDRCVAGFRGYLQTLPATERQQLQVEPVESFDYRSAVKQWMAVDPSRPRKVTEHPLWPYWTAYQCHAAASFMRELHELAASMAGHPVLMGANAGLLWPRHLADYRTLDLFSAETDHHAARHQFSDTPLFAYRLADAVDRPYAATASGGDWAHIKERNLPGLVRGWIALSYAAGHCFMVPNHQWCYTPEKGTHWYNGPAEKFAPLYQFVRHNPSLFNDYSAFADVAAVLPHRSFVANPDRWFALCQQLVTNNLSYRLLLGGDDIVDHPLTRQQLEANRFLLAPVRDELLPADRRLLDEHTKAHPAFSNVPELLTAITPAVRVAPDQPVRALPRTKPGSAVIHLLNYRYEVGPDDVIPLRNVRITINTSALGVPDQTACSLFQPGRAPQTLPVTQGVVEIPELGLWGLLVLEKGLRD